jgi:sulfite exporter TauE/SafE
MCGGIVGALSMGAPGRWSMHLAYNGGRIASYVLAGALAGSLGAASLSLEGQLPARLLLYLLANLMLVALGLYLLGVTSALAFTERLGQLLWARLQPLTRRFLPARSVAQAFPLGLLWGGLDLRTGQEESRASSLLQAPAGGQNKSSSQRALSSSSEPPE